MEAYNPSGEIAISAMSVGLRKILTGTVPGPYASISCLSVRENSVLPPPNTIFINVQFLAT